VPPRNNHGTASRIGRRNATRHQPLPRGTRLYGVIHDSGGVTDRIGNRADRSPRRIRRQYCAVGSYYAGHHHEFLGAKTHRNARAAAPDTLRGLRADALQLTHSQRANRWSRHSDRRNMWVMSMAREINRVVAPFKVEAPYEPAGDQPQAIAELAERVDGGEKDVVLMGATGTGKSATAAWLVERLQRPTLVLVQNKTLAAQLANEFRDLLPNNAIEYFVSYYDYYQPEAYVPQTDTFIEKDSS